MTSNIDRIVTDNMKTRSGEEVARQWRDWVALRTVRGVGPVVYQGLLRAFGAPRAVFEASAHALECAGVRPEVAGAIHRFDRWNVAERQIACVMRNGAHLVCWSDASYPQILRRIHDPPPFLIVKGGFEPQDGLAIAVVGSRRVSAYGLRVTQALAAGLARHGITVVSGMARGTDAAAHWAALRAGGRTIAVLGSGIDVVYPSEHHSLFRAIARQGAVVTELLMGTKPDAENFPARNRIVSGLALGTVVVEASERSGSLITASLAAEQGREVFAVPGAVGEATRGTHRLIREGAKLTECVEDILEEIAPQIRSQARPAVAVALDDHEAAIMRDLGDHTLHIDEVIARTGMAPHLALQALLALELKGLIEQLPGKRFLARAIDAGRRQTQE
jgi:DNA processing protein